MLLIYRIIGAFLLLAPMAGHSQVPNEPVTGAVVMEGATAFSQQQLFPLYQDLLGIPVDAQQRQRLRQAVTSLYTDQGFAAPNVRIASDPRSDMVMRVMIDEPDVTAVKIRGFSASGRRSLRRLAQAAVDYPGPLSQAQFDALHQRLEDASDRRINLKLEKQPGADARYTLVVSPEQRLHGSLTYSLEGSDRLGRQLVYGRLVLENPARYASRAYLSALHTLTSDGFRSFGAGLTLAPAVSHRVRLATSFARARPQDSTRDERYDRQWYRLQWHHRLINAPRREMGVFSGLTVREYTFEADSEERVDERLRVAGLGLDNRWRWRGRTLFIQVSGRQGLDHLGAQREGPGATRDTDLDFAVFKTRATLWQSLPAGFSLKLDAGGQYSDDYLPFSERFSIGSYRYGRAYEPGEFSGDGGLGSKVEFRRGFSVPALGGSRLVPYTYYGIARVYDNQRDEHRSGAAAGIGLRWLGDGARAYMELGRPLTTESDYREDDLRLTGRLTVRLP